MGLRTPKLLEISLIRKSHHKIIPFLLMLKLTTLGLTGLIRQIVQRCELENRVSCVSSDQTTPLPAIYTHNPLSPDSLWRKGLVFVRSAPLSPCRSQSILSTHLTRNQIIVSTYATPQFLQKLNPQLFSYFHSLGRFLQTSFKFLPYH